MANYDLNAGETRFLVDQNAAKIAAAATGVGAHDEAVIVVAADAAGDLTVRGVAPGSSGVSLIENGTSVEHTITVAPAPFDWSVGGPV